MANEHLNADELVLFEKLVHEIAAIIQGEVRDHDDQLIMMNDYGHAITLKYQGTTIYVYSNKIDLQGNGSGIKSYTDGLLWNLMQDNDVKDRLLERGSKDWLSKIDAAKPE